MKKTFVALSLFLLIAVPASAYVEPVHRIMTLNAFKRVEPGLALQSHLGITPGERLQGRTPAQWAEQGADDEDNGINALSHFYDPRHQAALTIKPFCRPPVTARTAPARAAAHMVDVNRAYVASVIGLGAEIREASARELFWQIGRVVHLIQDMGQPEHTRNDQHRFANGARAASIYEDWGAVHLLRRNAAALYEGYPTVHMPSLAEYFHTADAPLGIPAGRGLADFSNNNFVTQDTNYNDQQLNLGCFYYDLPILPGEESKRYVTTTEMTAYSGTPIEVEHEVFTSRMTDVATGGSAVDEFHTFRSSLDIETGQRGVRFYSLGDGSYASRAAILLPRAVGYTAGAIERVFRGRVAIKWKETVAGTYDMTVTNQSQEAIGADARLLAYLRIVDDKSTTGDLRTITESGLATLIPGFAGIPAGASVTARGIKPDLPARKKLGEFEKRIVVRSTMGGEDAVIGLVQPPSGKEFRAVITWAEPTAPNSLYMEDLQEFIGWYPWRTQYCALPDQSLADACVSSPASLQPVTFTWDPLPEDKLLRFYVGATLTRTTHTITTRFYIDGNLVKTQTTFVKTDRDTSYPFPEFARYP
ncbi:MAG TPA: hypothetical protein VF911_06815 [Thermoanaerobaculia bacterium]